MKYFFRTLDGYPESLRGGAIAVGNFDGVHRGHRCLIEQLRQLADRSGGPAVVLTFDPPPVAILAPGALPPALTWMDRRAELLHRLGVDVVVAYPTDVALLQMEPEDFYRVILREKLGGTGFVEGPNFHFGRNRRGDIRMLERLARGDGYDVSMVLAETRDGEMLSSSRIRQLLQQGKLDEANAMLVEPYRLRGRVVQGAGRGRGLGFPTANVGALQVMSPGFGVYGGRAWVGGESYRAAVNVGPNPTFGESQVKIEAHLLDFDGDLYERELEVELWFRIRDTKRFGSVGELTEQLHRDLAVLRSHAGRH